MTVNHKRKTVEQQVGTIDVEYVTLGQVLKQVKDLVHQYGSEAKVKSYNHRYDERDYHGGVFIDVPETDEQMVARIKQEGEWALQQAERERKEFERLSVKFAKKE